MSTRVKNAADDVVTHQEIIQRRAHDALKPSPTNPRKHFPAGPLKELAENIIALARRALANGTDELGVQQPLFVRGDEIIAGERRWRATELAMEIVQGDADAGEVIARLRLLPVIEKRWNDAEVVEFQLIENLRRDDLTPLEEADGYQRMRAMGNTPEQISAKVGTDVNQVYRALKWSRLPPLARQVFEQRLIGKEQATLIARIPDADERRRAALEVIFFTDEEISGEDAGWLESCERGAAKMIERGAVIEPLPVRKMREHIANFYMTSLRDVTFDPHDAGLVPEQRDAAGERVCGGRCDDCPFRTGCNPLFAGETGVVEAGAGSLGGMSPDICTKPSCLRMKVAAQWEKDVADAKERGLRVLKSEEAQNLFERFGGCALRPASKYVELCKKPDWNLTGHLNDSKVKTWEQYLKGREAPMVLAQDARGVTRRLIERDLAITAVSELCAEKGRESPFKADVVKSVAPSLSEAEMTRLKSESVIRNVPLDQLAEAAQKKKAAAEKKKKELEKVIENEARADTMRELREKLAKAGLGLDGWDCVWMSLIENVREEKSFCVFFGIDAKDWMARHDAMEGLIEGLPLNEKQALCIIAMMWDDWQSSGEGCDLFRDLAKLHKVSLDDVRKRVRKAHEVDAKQGKAVSKNRGRDAGGAEDRVDVAKQAEITAAADRLHKLKRASAVKAAKPGADDGKAVQAQVSRIVKGASYTDVLGKTPKKGTPEHKEWEARRVKLVRAVKKHIGGK